MWVPERDSVWDHAAHPVMTGLLFGFYSRPKDVSLFQFSSTEWL